MAIIFYRQKTMNKSPKTFSKKFAPYFVIPYCSRFSLMAQTIVFSINFRYMCFESLFSFFGSRTMFSDSTKDRPADDNALSQVLVFELA